MIDFMGRTVEISEILNDSQLSHLKKHVLRSIQEEPDKKRYYEDILRHQSTSNALKPVIFDHVSLPYQYIKRQVSKRKRLNEAIFKINSNEKHDEKDVFVFTKDIKKSMLTKLAHPHLTTTSRNQYRKITHRFIRLDFEDDWNDIKKISKQPTHLIMYIKDTGEFVLSETSKPTNRLRENLLDIGSVLDEGNLYAEVDPNKNSSRVYLVCGRAGIGKSSLLNTIAQNLTEKHQPDCWVIKLRLWKLLKYNKLTEKVVTDVNQVRDLLCSFTTGTSLGHLILECILKHTDLKVVLCVDEIDCLDTANTDLALKMLKTILESRKNLLIYIVARPNKRLKLETFFATLSYSLLPLTPKDQCKFLAEQWKNILISDKKNPSELCIEKLKKYGKYCIQELKQLLGSKEPQLIGNPLQCMLVSWLQFNQARIYSCPRRDIDFDDCKLNEVFVPKLNNTLLYKAYISSVCETLSPDTTLAKIKHWLKYKAIQFLFPEVSDEFVHLFDLHSAPEPKETLEAQFCSHNYSTGKCEIISLSEMVMSHPVLAEYLTADAFFDVISSPQNIDKNNIRWYINIFMFMIRNVMQTETYQRYESSKFHASGKIKTIELFTFTHPEIIDHLNTFLEHLDDLRLSEMPSLYEKIAIFLNLEQLIRVITASLLSNSLHLLRFLKLIVKEVKHIAKSGSLVPTLVVPIQNLAISDLKKFASVTLYTSVEFSCKEVVQECYNFFNECYGYDLDSVYSEDVFNDPTPLHYAMQIGNKDQTNFFFVRALSCKESLIRFLNYTSCDFVNNKIRLACLLVRIINKDSEHCIDALSEYNLRHLVNYLVSEPDMELVHFSLLHIPEDVLLEFLCYKYEQWSTLDLLFHTNFSDIEKLVNTSFKYFYTYCKNLNIPMLRHLFSNLKRIDLNHTGEDNQSILHIEIERFNRPEVIKCLIEHGADFKLKNLNDQNPLHLSAMYGNKETMDIFISRKISLNSRDKNRNTPLHLAVSNWSNLLHLIKNGADVCSQNSDGDTVAHLAFAPYFFRLFEEIKKQKRLEVYKLPNKYGQTPLQKWLQSDQKIDVESLEVLITVTGFDLNVIDCNGNNLLLSALIGGKPFPIIKFLTEKGVDFTQINNFKQNTMSLCNDRKNNRMTNYFTSKFIMKGMTEIQVLELATVKHTNAEN